MNGTQSARVALGIAGAVVGLGSVLPWITVSSGLGSVSVNGTDDGRDGWITLGLAVVVIVVVLVPWSKTWRALLATVLGLVAFGVGVYDWVDIRNKITDLPDAFHGSVGFGLWLTIFAALAVIGCGIWFYAADDPADGFTAPAR